MNPGDFREVITVKNATVQDTDKYGQANPDPYEADGTLRAAIDTSGGGTTEQGAAELGQDRIQARVRRPLPSGYTIAENTILEWKGEEYQVETVEKIGRQRGVVQIDAVRQ